MGTPVDDLRARLESDVLADLGSLRTDTDKALSIGSDVWRLRWGNQPTVAIAGDASLATTCGAVLDALALRGDWAASPELSTADVDLDTVNLLIDRDPPGSDPTESDQAVRTMRDAVQGAVVRVWYRSGSDDWSMDTHPPPTWPADDTRILGWVTKLLIPRLTAAPQGLAAALAQAVDDPSFQLYPSEIRAGVPNRWSLRIDGLEVGTASEHTAVLTIGRPGKAGDGPQRAAFIELAGAASLTVATELPAPPRTITVAAAAEMIRQLLSRFRPVDLRGAPVCHRTRAGEAFVDEHALEARLLKGLTRLDDDTRLVCGDEVVARGSQFPTLWGRDSRARYLDALLTRGTTPVAVELKVSTGGHGRYYRRALAQAALYRHFIRNAPALDPWFDHAELDRSATTATVGIPVPRRWSADFERRLEGLRRIADLLDIELCVIDDRSMPALDAQADHPEAGPEQIERQTWRLASALIRRWPRELGYVVHTHPMDFYDLISLRPPQGSLIGPPWRQAHVTLNRPGSLRVITATGAERWRWSGIWEHLANGGDVEEAAVLVGAVAALPEREPGSGPTFAQLADRALALTASADWTWQCAWQDGWVPEWIERYEPVLRRYARRSDEGRLPSLSRIWGAVRHGAAVALVDQTDLRAWIWDGSPRLLQGELARSLAAIVEAVDG